jgi:hypothetical protein
MHEPKRTENTENLSISVNERRGRLPLGLDPWMASGGVLEDPLKAKGEASKRSGIPLVSKPPARTGHKERP